MIKNTMNDSSYKQPLSVWRPARVAEGRKMVRLSMAVAFIAPFGVAIAPQDALGQMVATCTNRIDFGKFAIAGGMGSLTVTPGGSVPNRASIVTISAPQPGQCKISGFTGTTGTLQIQISQTKASLVNGGNVMTIDKFNIATKNAGRTKTWFSASLTKTTMTYDIGARLRATGGDAAGAYSGSIIVIHTYTN